MALQVLPFADAIMSSSFLAAVATRALEASASSTASSPASSTAGPSSPVDIEAFDLSQTSLEDMLKNALADKRKEAPPDWGGMLHCLGTQKPDGVCAPQFVRPLPSGDFCCSCARSSKVAIISPAGKLVRQVGVQPSDGRPISLATGIASAGDALFVSDHFNHRVLKLALSSGELLAAAGSDDGTDGSGVDEFDAPEDLVLSFDGRLIFVADRNNSRIVVLDSATLTWRGQIGKEGRREGELYIPIGLALDASTNELLVADSINRRVSVFEARPNGKFLRSIAGDLDEPLGLLLVSGLLFVTEERRVAMLEWPSGRELASVGTGSGLKGLCAAPGRRLCVADEAAGLLHILGAQAPSAPQAESADDEP